MSEPNATGGTATGLDGQVGGLELAAQRLQASELRYRRLFEAAKDGILILDADTGKIVDVNPYLEELTGYSHADFLGRRLWDIGPFKDIAASRASFADLLATEYVRHDDLPLQARDGRRIDVEFVSNVYRVEARSVIQCNIRDITVRKSAEAERARLEDQLRASQRLEAIGSLAGGVAHDFNNLLSVILSYSGLALEAVHQDDPLRLDLLEVQKAGERAAILTRQLLAFSRRQVLKPVALDLNRIVVDVGKMLRRLVGEDVEIVQRLAEDLGVVRADPGQLEQVLVNLVVNARDAMLGGGRLEISTANVELDAGEAARRGVPPGAHVQLSLTDSGCGMDAATQAQVFEPFFTTKAQGKGTGLGLSTVYGIVKQSGGSVWSESAPGRGSTFRILLPREPGLAAALVPGEAAAQPAPRGTETVLVVEDEAALLEVARRTLEGAGYTVLTASDGEAALATFQAHDGEIQLLLTDVVMPRMGGRALAQALLGRQPELKVLYVSGYPDEAIFQGPDAVSALQFLAKPFTAAELARQVRRVLDGLGTGGGGPARAAPGDPEAAAPPSPAALAALAPELRLALGQAAASARHGEFVALLERIVPPQPTLVAGLRRLADDFDWDGLRGLLSRRGAAP